MNSRFMKTLIILLGVATLLFSILSLVFMGQKNSTRFFTFKMISQCTLVIEFVLISIAMYRQRRTRKNALVILVCALVFAVSAVQTLIGHH